MAFRLKSSVGKLKRAVEGLLDSLEKATQVSNSLEKIEIGVTESGSPIFCYKIGNGKKKILLISGIHGNEVGTVKLAYKILDYTQRHISDYENLTIFVVPVVNVDGYVQASKKPDYWNGGKIGRLNMRNVDLNRNFDTKSFKQESIWSFGKNYEESIEVFCGKEGGSETETRALTRFVSEQGIYVVCSFHNSGADVMPGNSELSSKLSNIFSNKSGYRVISHKEWSNLKQTGTFKEWCDDRKVNFLEIEGKSRWGSDWRNQKNAIMTMLSHLNRNTS